MTSAKPLSVKSAFGSSLRNTFLLAAHPDETHDAKGNALPHARSFLLELQGTRAVVREELPLPLVRSWYSPSGTAYCGSVARGTIHKWHGGQWSIETFSSRPVEFVRYAYVWPGDIPEEDTVFLATREDVFIRQDGTWRRERVPGEGFPLQMVGTRADQVFIGGPQLCLWDGEALSMLQTPRGDTTSCLALSADDRIIAGSTYVNASTPDGGWERLKSPIRGFTAFARFQDTVFALSDDHGVTQIYPGPVASLTRPLKATGLVSVGDGLIAIGRNGVFAFDGQDWTDVQIPTCEVGKRL